MKIVFAVLLMFCCVGNIHADIITMNLDHEFSGADKPAGTSTPWLRAIFSDIDSGGVNLTMEAVGLVDAEKVTEWYFNVDTTDQNDFDDFEFSHFQGVFGTNTVPWIDSHKADGDGLYDFMFNFAQSGNDVFTAGLISSWDIMGTLGDDGITAADFNVLSTPAGGNGPFTTAAHVQSIDPNDEGSGWIAPSGAAVYGAPNPVPEPSSFVAFAGLFTMGGLAFFRRRKKAVA